MTIVAAMVTALLAFVTAPAAHAVPTVVASALTSGPDVGVISYTNSAPAFASAGDAFEVLQRGVSPSIPFAVADDSLGGFPADNQGIIDESNLGPFFGIVDTQNGDNSGPVTATWTFDISGASALTVSADIGAMGDFEAADSFEFSYSIDGAPATPLWSLTVDESASRSYTMAGSSVFLVDDPLNLGPNPLDNVLTTFTSALPATGSTLAVSITAVADGGSEAVAFQNLIVSGEAGGPPPPPVDPVINEYVVDHIGSDTHEYVEILGDPNTDYSSFTVVEIEGDSGSSTGQIDDATFEVGTTDANGYWTTGFQSNAFENGSLTILLVEGFFGSVDQDLDTNDDGTLDVTPWTRIVDSVGVDEGGTVYGTPNLASGFDGIGFNVSGASRIPNGTDTDTTADWVRNHYFGAGLPGFGGTPSIGEGWNTPGAANEVYVPAFLPVKIHDIQGELTTPAVLGGVEIQGVVTSIMQRDDNNDGFFVQEEEGDYDANPLTSEGIYVHCRGGCPVAIAEGDLVTVQGDAEDFFGMTQVDATGGGSIIIDSSGNPLPAPVAINLPAAGSTVADATFEAYEGMIATFPDTLAVSEYFQLGRFGQIVLTETSRPYQFTHSNAPSVAGYTAFLDDLGTRRIILDDDNNDNNDFISDGPDELTYHPTGGLSTGNKVRGGDTIAGMTGVLHWSFAGGSNTDAWRVRPLSSETYEFTSVNPNPGGPANVGGDLKVASFNVLNYFTTIDVTSSSNSGDCGPSGTLDCRGADSEAERLRQRAKIVAALVAMDVDVAGLVELENDGDDSSIADLVAGLNDATAPGTYDYIATGFIGEDAIKVGLIYKPGMVSSEGAFAVLDSADDPTFIDSKNRPALIQTFSENATGERFTVAVNHFKSKGSPCDDVGDPGLNDGQANCAVTRADAATALANHLATDPTGSGDDRYMILGDLNAYAKEWAIANLEAAGYTNLMAAFNGPSAYSYVFDGQLGYLDYALANDALVGSVTGVTEWHINADEVPLFDYNDDIRDAGEASFERESSLGTLYAPDALRSSDHDPVIVGLNLANPMGDKEDVLAALNAAYPSGDDHTDNHLEKAIEHLEHSLNPDYWTSDQTVTSKKVFDEERKTVKEIEKAVEHGIFNEAQAEDLMDALVNADRLLARIAIISAPDRGVSEEEVEKAEQEMVKAANYWADGKYYKAIDKYKKAWDTVNRKKHLPQ
jgi:predicted extracellular nuclease